MNADRVPVQHVKNKMQNGSLISKLLARPEVGWKGKKPPIAIIDDKVHSVSDIKSRVHGKSAYIVGVNQKSFASLCDHIDVETLHFYQMRVEDISPISKLRRLKQLAIVWNTKLTNLHPICSFAPLEVLVLQDIPKLRDLSALETQIHLQALELAGNLGSLSPKAKFDTLEPVGRLTNLNELCLKNISVFEDGLRPVANCKQLRNLSVPNTFETENYAYLAAKLPNTSCTHFSAYITVKRVDEDGNTRPCAMVIGKRKPFLDPIQDKERLNNYIENFERLYQKNLDG